MKIEELYTLYRNASGVTIDSRQVPSGSLFFAITGERFDGNRFAEEALKKGATYAIIDNPDYQTNEQTLLVEDSLATLQELATHHRQQLDLPILAITGSNGKTTTKELITAVLQSTYQCYGTQGNLNNHIGVPLSLLKLSQAHDIAVIEMGANHRGEIAQLCNIAQPNYGLITNIGAAHLKGFGSIEGVRQAKGELYDYIRETQGLLFVNRDHTDLDQMSQGVERVTYGASSGKITGTCVSSSPRLTVSVSKPSVTIHTQLVGDYNLENVLAAVCVGRYFDISPSQIKKSIEEYVPRLNRSQVIQKAGNTFIMDAYNANPVSMKAALRNFAKIESAPKMVILGDMLELGDVSTKEHRKIVQYVNQQPFDQVIWVGKEFGKAREATEGLHFQNVDQLQQWFDKQDFKGYHILLKGSRELQLEKLLND